MSVRGTHHAGNEPMPAPARPANACLTARLDQAEQTAAEQAEHDAAVALVRKVTPQKGTRPMISELTEPLNGLDWNDTDTVNTASSKLLDTLATDRALLRPLVEQVPGNERLCELSEHYDILDKLLLHDDPSGFRLRLHVFLPGYFDRPHNHRWTYTSRILRGSYQHTLYGMDNNLDESICGRSRNL